MSFPANSEVASAASSTASADSSFSAEAQAASSASSLLSAERAFSFHSESYRDGVAAWPSRGRHILAQFHAPGSIRHLTGDDDGAILVYQAFNRQIGEYAVAHQSFAGCPGFRLTRMSWLKTNFLWMMYRCNWCKKSSQAMVLGVWIRTSFFERLLLKTTSTQGKGTKVKLIQAKQKDFDRKLKKAQRQDSSDDDSDADDADWSGSGGSGGNRNMVCRHQWDPDHRPDGEAVTFRKALQIGMRGALLREYAQADTDERTNKHRAEAAAASASASSASAAASSASSSSSSASGPPRVPILSIVDVTPFVIQQRARLAAMKRAEKTQPYTLLVARERTYTHLPAEVAKHVGLDAEADAPAADAATDEIAASA